MGEDDWRRSNNQQGVWNDNRGPQQYWVQRRTICPDGDVTHMFYVKDMFTKPKRGEKDDN